MDALVRLNGVIDRLLGQGGCPWDQKQTPKTLCDYLLEEAYELIEAIRADNPQEAKKELGDLTFLLLFIAKLYQRDGAFSFEDALDASTEKMIRRHPHVFGDLTVNSQDELLRNWERIKREEKRDEAGEASPPHRTFADLPKGLPPLIRAYKIHSKAARIGFTFDSTKAVQQQADAERAELEAAILTDDPKAIEAEFGDRLFTLVELGRRLGVKANAALSVAVEKFLNRFERMEQIAESRGLEIAGANMTLLNSLWNEAKS